MTHNPYGGPHADVHGQGMQPVEGSQPGQPQSPASGYPFGPFAPDQGTAGPFEWDPTAGHPDDYSAQPPAGPEPGRGRRTLLVVGVSALALIILGVGSAIVAINLLQARTTEQSSGASTGPSSSASPAVGARPSDAVLGYLTALASGDAQEALAYAQSGPTESSLLTDKALSTALNDAPLTAIEVPPVDGDNEAVVKSSYKLGKRSVTETFDVVKQDDAWKLRRVAAEVELGPVRNGAVPLLINGTKVSAELISLFPGSYEISTGLKYSDYGNESTILITSPSGFPDTSRLGLRITAKGKAAAVAAAKKTYTKCLKSDDPAPAKCPNRWTSDAAKWRKGSVDWKQQGSDPFKNAKVTTSGVSAEVQIPLRVELSGTCTQGGRTGRCVGATMTGTSVSVVSLETDSPKVRWLLPQ